MDLCYRIHKDWCQIYCGNIEQQKYTCCGGYPTEGIHCLCLPCAYCSKPNEHKCRNGVLWSIYSPLYYLCAIPCCRCVDGCMIPCVSCCGLRGDKCCGCYEMDEDDDS